MVVGAAVVVVASEDVVVSSAPVEVGASVVVVSAEAWVWAGAACVVAVRLSASETLSASTADATRADVSGLVGATVVSGVASSEPEDGENAAKPTTATRAMMRRPAYASGMRGLT